MADISLKISTDFEKAAADMKAFNQLTASQTEQMRRYVESFKTEQIDRFIAAQDRQRIALTATRGTLDATQTELRNVQREIERLITKGIDPNSQALQPLISKYAQLQAELDDTKTKTAQLEKETRAYQERLDRLSSQSIDAAKAALFGIAAAATAAIVATAKLTKDFSEAGDELETSSKKIGISVEALQQLRYAADLSDVSSETLTAGLEKLNLIVGDLRNGTGALYTSLKANNTQLLEQFQNVQNNEQAFNLALKAISETTNEFDRAALANDLFGKSGKELLLLTADGIDNFNALKKEVLDYGIISTQAAAQAGEFDNAQKRLNAALLGARNEFISGLLPGLTQTLDKAAEWVATGDNLQNALKTVGLVTAGAASGLAAFLVVAKGASLIKTLTDGFKALNVAVAANPIGAIAVAISSIAVPAFIALADKTGIFLSTADKLNRTNKELGDNTTALKRSTEEYKAANDQLNTSTNTLNETEKKTLETRRTIAGLEVSANLQKTIKTLEDYEKQQKKLNQTTLDSILKVADLNTRQNTLVAAITEEQARIDLLNASLQDNKTNRFLVAQQLEAANGRLKFNTEQLDKNKKAIQDSTTEAEKNKLLVEQTKLAYDQTIDTLATFLNLELIKESNLRVYNKELAEAITLRAKQLAQETKAGGTPAGAPPGVIPPAGSGQQAQIDAQLRASIQKNKEALEDLNATKRQSIILDLQRAEAEIKASKASAAVQQEALIAVQALYEKKLALYDEEERKANSSLENRLSGLNNKEAEQQAENISQFKDFLQARIDQENISGGARERFLETEYARITKLESLSAEEKADALKAVRDLALQYNKEEQAAKQKAIQETADAENKSNQASIDAQKKAQQDKLALIQDYIKQFQSVLDIGVSLFNTFADIELQAARDKYSQLSEQEIAYQALLDSQREESLQKQINRLNLLQSANFNSYSGLSDQEIAYQEFLRAEKDTQIQADKDRLTQLQADFAEAKDQETKTAIQADIATLQHKIEKNALEEASNQAKFERERQREAEDLQAQIQADQAKAAADAAKLARDEQLAKAQRKIARDTAIAQRLASSSSVAALTAEAIYKSYVASPTTFGLPWSAFYAADGIAKLIAINAPQLPSAQTGTGDYGFTVPINNSTTRADSTALMVSPGERVDVTPIGEETSRGQSINIYLDSNVLYKVVNRGIINGDINITMDNIKGRKVS